MVKPREFYETREDGVNLYKTESDSGMMIRKVGTDLAMPFAIDVEENVFEYEETDIPIPPKPPLSDWAKKRLGVTE